MLKNQTGYMAPTSPKCTSLSPLFFFFFSFRIGLAEQHLRKIHLPTDFNTLIIQTADPWPRISSFSLRQEYHSKEGKKETAKWLSAVFKQINVLINQLAGQQKINQQEY